MKNISIEERVLNSVNNAIRNTIECLCISVDSQTVIKMVYNSSDDTMTVNYLEKDGWWEDCLTIHHISERNKRFIANIVMSLNF